MKSRYKVFSKPLEDCFNKNAFVNMLNGWWKEESLDGHDPEDLEDDELEAVLQELKGYDPIEGYTVKDVGWIISFLSWASLMNGIDITCVLLEFVTTFSSPEYNSPASCLNETVRLV
jgi:hypothetical protein